GTADRGVTWTILSDGVLPDRRPNFIAVASSEPDILYAALDPNDFGPYMRLADVYEQTGRLQEALALTQPGNFRTLPHTRACSTIGAEGLNFRVRDGNGWVPLAMVTQKERSAYSDQHSARNRSRPKADS